MTLAEYIALFIEYDRNILAEQPEDFDLAAAKDKFAAFATDLLRERGEIYVRMHPALQDRSYHGEIALPWFRSHAPYRFLDRQDNRDQMHIRVSNFGSFVTTYFEPLVEGAYTPFHVSLPDKYQPDDMDMAPLLVLFRKWGYRYIPLTVLQQPYTRGDAIHWWVESWFSRYFGIIA